jgi:hypothetical protein
MGFTRIPWLKDFLAKSTTSVVDNAMLTPGIEDKKANDRKTTPGASGAFCHTFFVILGKAWRRLSTTPTSTGTR